MVKQLRELPESSPQAQCLALLEALNATKSRLQKSGEHPEALALTKQLLAKEHTRAFQFDDKLYDFGQRLLALTDQL